MRPKVLIIGGGPAALTAAVYLSRGGADPLLIEKNSIGGQIADCPRVDNYPGIPAVSGIELADKMFNQATDLGAGFELDEITGVVKEGNAFKAKGRYAAYIGDAVIIANGARHKHLGVEGEEGLVGHGVSYCAVCDGAFFQGEDVLVIGDANSALQYAITLSSLCKKVTVVTLFDKFFGEESLVKTLFSLPNVSVLHNLNTISFNGDENLESVTFENTKSKERVTIPAAGAFIAVGQEPDNRRFANIVELDEKGYIVTDESMASSTPGVFAAGDTRQKKIRQVVTAENDGAIAALGALNYLRSIN